MDDKKRIPPWLVLCLSTAVFYAVSFGPLYYALVSIGAMPPSPGQKVLTGIVALYSPHFWLRDNVGIYYHYSGWWAELARPDLVVPPWDDANGSSGDRTND